MHLSDLILSRETQLCIMPKKQGSPECPPCGWWTTAQNSVQLHRIKYVLPLALFF